MVEALTGTIPSSIKNAKGLIYLDVANNQLTGELNRSQGRRRRELGQCSERFQVTPSLNPYLLQELCPTCLYL
jgi:hypothetical protein